MNWFTQTFTSSIGRKIVVALTGLFLIVFLIGHVSGNFLLFKDDGGQSFNEYTEFMTHNQLILVVRYLLYISIIVHVLQTLILTIHNRKARPVGYTVNNRQENSTWASRNMGILGTLVLVFIVLHMSNFWWKVKFGDIPMVNYESRGEIKDLYSVVQASFSEPLLVAVYVIMMIFLALHLAHGFQSAFQTLGWRHPKYTPLVKKAGLAFAIIVPILFASFPIFIYLFRNINA
jgi:succinate dehydrogenase / fumarate reductase cytochrome b subunit